MMRFILLALFFFARCLAAQEFLDPAVAFRPTVQARDGQTLEVRFEIARGYYLYRDKFRFSLDGAGPTLGTPVFPAGKQKQDEAFGKVEVYYGEVTIRLPVERNQSGEIPLTLKLSSQGCADAGVCYPPQAARLSVTLPAELPVSGAAGASATGGAPAAADETGQIARTLRDSGLAGNLLFFFLAGLGLSLTPCVFPMIPILSGIIAGGRGSAPVSRRRGFILALAYVLGMALTYSAAGVAAGLTGTLVSGLLQNAWVLGGFALIFVALACAMFGLYELQLPSSLQSRLSEGAGRLPGGRLAGVFVMGALSALIVGPCVAAPLAGALLYIGQTGNALFGGAVLFVMALGMGMPLLAVGLSAGTLLPRAGAWMDAVRKAFGVLLLATALWLVSPVLPAAAVLTGWAALFILPAVFLRALDPLPPHAHGWQRFWKGVGVLLLLVGVAQLAGALSGARDPLRPLAAWQGSRAEAAEVGLPFEPVASLAALEARLANAGRPVMLDFYADWCVSCKEMERDTFTDPAVRAALGNYVLLRADVTASSPADRALLARFGLFGPPGLIFFDAQGRELPERRIVGFKTAPEFLASLGR